MHRLSLGFASQVITRVGFHPYVSFCASHKCDAIRYESIVDAREPFSGEPVNEQAAYIN
jgi:hypothetical protein